MGIDNILFNEFIITYSYRYIFMGETENILWTGICGIQNLIKNFVSPCLQNSKRLEFIILCTNNIDWGMTEGGGERQLSMRW